MSRCLFVAVVLVGSGFFSACLAEPPVLPPDPDAQTISRHLDDWRNSFTTLRMVYRWNNPGQWIQRRPELAAPGALDGYHHREEWYYSRDGRYRFDGRRFEAGQPIERTVHSNDGHVGYSCEYIGDEKYPRRIRTHISPTGLLEKPGLDSCAGLGMGKVQWINEMFTEFSIQKLSFEELDGAPCAVVSHSSDETKFISLDLLHDGLIKQIVSGTGVNQRRLSVETFRQLENGRWFPVRISELTSMNDTPYEREIEEVQANTLTDADFVIPEVGPDTRIEGSRMSTLMVKRADGNDQAHSLGATAADQNTSRRVRIWEIPLSGRPWMWSLLGGSIAFLVCYRRRQHRWERSRNSQ